MAGALSAALSPVPLIGNMVVVQICGVLEKGGVPFAGPLGVAGVATQWVGLGGFALGSPTLAYSGFVASAAVAGISGGLAAWLEERKGVGYGFGWFF